MRYFKVLLLVLIFFLSMVFFFQNQEALSMDVVLKLNLFFLPPMTSIALPFYFLVLASFLTGALLAFVALVWDRVHLSAKYMKAVWRVRALEKEINELKPSSEARRFGNPSAAQASSAQGDVKAPDPDEYA